MDLEHAPSERGVGSSNLSRGAMVEFKREISELQRLRRGREVMQRAARALVITPESAARKVVELHQRSMVIIEKMKAKSKG